MNKTIKKELILEGLHCANCASKIELKVNELNDVELASLNFITKTLSIQVEENKKVDSVMSLVKDIIHKLEPHVIVSEKGTNNVHDNQEHNHDHDHQHSHVHNHTLSKNEIIKLSLGTIIFAIVIIFNFSSKIEITLFLISYILIGGSVLIQAVKNIMRGQIFDENFLMATATIGALGLQEYPEAVAVMLFYQAGEFMQSLAVNRSRKSISELMDIRPDYANLITDNNTVKVSPEKVKIDDLILVKPGEKVPLDGIITKGTSTMDTSALTGESAPRDVQSGSEVLSGFINKNSVITIKVTKSFSESTVSKILDLVQNASSKKAPTENFITKFSRYYTPTVVFSALALAVIPPLVIQGATFSEWISRALIFLVVSCPCALVVSIPLGFFGGIGGASKNGILIKGGNYLEALNNVETVVFDKTGTLTKGVFKVTNIVPSNNISKDDLLKYAAYVESYSNHPIALSIVNKYNEDIDKSQIDNYEEISGNGIKSIINGKEILAGNEKLMSTHNIEYHTINNIDTVIHLAIDNKYAGHIIISDEIKEDSSTAIKGLKSIGIKQTVMLTGDNFQVAEKISNELSLDKVYAELLPQHKVEKVENLQKDKSPNSKLIFVGDGINDAPVLARADIGIAMGGLGSDAAIEAADVVLMTDEPSKIVTAINIAKRTKKIIWQNIIFSLGIKGIVLILGAMGYASMWAAVFADVGVALIAVLNAMRALNVNNKYVLNKV